MPYFVGLPMEVKEILSKNFENKTVGTKIKHGQTIAVDPSYNYVLKNSYIRLKKDIYALAKGREALIGKGSFGRVKYACSLSTDKVFAIKIIPFISSDSSLEDIENELAILYDLGLYRDNGSRKSRLGKKQYIVMLHAGVNLNKYINTHPELNESTRIDLAIKMCWLVHSLHQGLSSRTFTPYAHRDLKPANAALDSAGVMRLIDLGLASHKLDAVPEEFAGTAAYLPNTRTFLTGNLVLRQLDILALKRVICMPNRLLCFDGYREDKAGKHFGLKMLLSPELLSKLRLFELFDTSTIHDKQLVLRSYQYNSDPIILATLLILARYNLLSVYGARMHDPILAYAVLGMYFANQDCSDLLAKANIVINLVGYMLHRTIPRYKALVDRIQYMALFVSQGITNHLNEAVNNKTLIALIKTSSPIIARAVALLWQNGFCEDVFLSKLYANEELAKNIIKLVFDGNLLGIKEVLSPPQLEVEAEPEIQGPTLPSMLETTPPVPEDIKKSEELREDDRPRIGFSFFMPLKAKETVEPPRVHQNIL